jgi:DNA-binding IclR family transcriptional regulator
MRVLAARTNETVVLAVLNPARDHAVCIEQIASPFGFRLVADIGVKLPLHAGGLSRVLLAYLDPQEVDAVLAAPLPRLAPGTITDAEQLRKSLIDVRRTGYAVSFEETCDGAAGVSVPIFNCDGQVLASLGVSGPRSRMPAVQDLVRDVGSAAEDIAAAVGGFTTRVLPLPRAQRPKSKKERTYG